MTRLGAAVVACVALAGCLGGPAVQNTAGHFEFTLDADGSSDRYEYEWSNDASVADVRWDLSMADGSVTLSILDDVGQEVFLETFRGQTQGGPVRTSAGRAGSWSVQLELDEATGPVKVKVRSA